MQHPGNGFTREAALGRLARLRGFLEHDPDNASLLLDIADLEIACGELFQARSCLQRVLELDPQHARALLGMSSVAIAEKTYNEAIDLTEQLIQDGHDEPAIHYNLAYALLESGRYDDACRLLSDLHEGGNSFPAVVRLYIRACHYAGDLDRAVAVASEHIQAHPADLDVAGMLSLLYFDIDDLSSAQQWAMRALEVLPENTDALLAAGGVALANENSARARGFLNRGISLNPTSGRIWMNLALADLLDLDLVAAEHNLGHALRYMPSHIGTWHVLGWIQLLQHNVNGAEKSFREAYALDENFGDTHGGLAAVSAAKGDWDTAERHSKIARRLDPESMSSYYSSILKLQASGQHNAALELILTALKSGQAPGGGNLLDMLTRRLQK